jgi:predicted DNA-binding WGR domain protein/ankyrin repeat protein
MKKHLTYKNEKSDKFWQIEVAGNSFTVTYGKTGTAGTSQTKSFDSEEKCFKEAEKLLNEKLRKGYKESKGATKVVAPSPAPKKKAGLTMKPADFTRIENYIKKSVSDFEGEVKDELDTDGDMGEFADSLWENFIMSGAEHLVDELKLGQKESNKYYDFFRKKFHEEFERLVSSFPIAVPQSKQEIDKELEEAVVKRNWHKVTKLINEGADPNTSSVLSRAVASSQTTLVDLLLTKGADPNIADNGGFTSFDLAVGSLPLSTIKLFIKFGAQKTPKLFFISVQNDSIIFFHLLEAFHISEMEKTNCFTEAGYRGNREIIDFFLENDMDINSKNEWGYTILHAAAMRPNDKNIAVIKFLLEKGADKKLKDKDGKQPFELTEGKHKKLLLP